MVALFGSSSDIIWCTGTSRSNRSTHNRYHYIKCKINTYNVNGVTVKDTIGDCICTFAPPIDLKVDDFRVINCTLENARRQGISFVATGENYLVKDCNIGNINGTDPQSGIDFEHYGYVKNVVIDGVHFYDNKKWDIINYNGTEIEVKNSNFTGGIATTYGHTMDIHDNEFEYKDRPKNDKAFKNTSLNITTENNKVYNNVFKGGSVTVSGENSELYSNTFHDAVIGVCCNGSNKYYNSQVTIKQNSNFPLLSDNYFENSDVSCSNDSPAIEIQNCQFENSSFNGRGTCIVKNSAFHLKDKYLVEGWKAASTAITFDTCEIKSDTSFLKSGLNAKLIFKNSTVLTAREKILNYGTTTFEDSKIVFLQDGKEEDFTWNIGGYGYEKCPWVFNNCTFESQLPVTIGGGNVTNATIEGNVTIE